MSIAPWHKASSWLWVLVCELDFSCRRHKATNAMHIRTVEQTPNASNTMVRDPIGKLSDGPVKMKKQTNWLSRYLYIHGIGFLLYSYYCWPRVVEVCSEFQHILVQSAAEDWLHLFFQLQVEEKRCDRIFFRLYRHVLYK